MFESSLTGFEFLIARPTLRLLDVKSSGAVDLLKGTILAQDRYNAVGHNRHSCFGISTLQHQQVWDQYLAFLPERASLVRGLASARLFLSDPHQELERSFAYATAIAWLLYEASGWQLPQQQDGDAMARLWSKVYYPQDQRAASFAPLYWRSVIHLAA